MKDSSCRSLIRTGTVAGYVQDGISVDVSTMETCRQCAEGRGCGLGLVARRQRQHIVLKPDCSSDQYQIRYPLGEPVTFMLAKNGLTSVALLVYALPLMFALLLSGGAAWLGVKEWFSAAIFFGALISSVVALRYRLRGRTERFRPRLVS
ncbi:SoxR reducing system RseC family protein [Vreelandella olivaria]|uniref:SoxR reducing system RseC family protein n=1 Tax=Vreelandella olivaria TaxID=390919 RepID=UPI00201F11F2|nr:SoxR reducing system RseC family protein [Halomonas olivaria]